MHSKDFETKIKAIDERFSIIDNPNRVGLSNIFFAGKNYDLPVISTTDIREEVDQSYRYEFPNGMRSRFWTQDEVTARLEDFVKEYTTGKFDGLYE